jgi:hypothetical protein
MAPLQDKRRRYVVSSQQERRGSLWPAAYLWDGELTPSLG